MGRIERRTRPAHMSNRYSFSNSGPRQLEDWPGGAGDTYRRVACPAVQITEGVGNVAGSQPRPIEGAVAEAGQEGVGNADGDIRRGRRRGPLLRLDRRAEGRARRP